MIMSKRTQKYLVRLFKKRHGNMKTALLVAAVSIIVFSAIVIAVIVEKSNHKE
jgi:hypothetical protein